MAFEIDHEAVAADGIFILRNKKSSSFITVAATAKGCNGLDKAGMAIGPCSCDYHPVVSMLALETLSIAGEGFLRRQGPAMDGFPGIRFPVA